MLGGLRLDLSDGFSVTGLLAPKGASAVHRKYQRAIKLIHAI
jgi:hypothetical protein